MNARELWQYKPADDLRLTMEVSGLVDSALATQLKLDLLDRMGRYLDGCVRTMAYLATTPEQIETVEIFRQQCEQLRSKCSRRE